MFSVFLGDDIAKSREAFIKLKEDYKRRGFQVFLLDQTNLSELDRWLYQSVGLFSKKKVFFGENLLSQKKSQSIIKKYASLDKGIDFVFWEEKLDEKAVRRNFKQAKIYSFKLPFNIFKLLDAVYPGNLKRAIAYLNQVSETVNENIILYMLGQRIRQLILIKNKLKPEKKLARWQVLKLKNQAEKWTGDQLASFYDSLYRLEVSIKTNKNYYSIKKSLDILFCYFI